MNGFRDITVMLNEGEMVFNISKKLNLTYEIESFSVNHQVC